MADWLHDCCALSSSTTADRCWGGFYLATDTLLLCRYFDFINFNTSGYRPYLTTLYAVLLGCLRKTISRVLVLIVSMGFGVIVPYLGAVQQKVCVPALHPDVPRQLLDLRCWAHAARPLQ